MDHALVPLFALACAAVSVAAEAVSARSFLDIPPMNRQMREMRSRHAELTPRRSRR